MVERVIWDNAMMTFTMKISLSTVVDFEGEKKIINLRGKCKKKKNNMFYFGRIPSPPPKNEIRFEEFKFSTLFNTFTSC